MALNEEDVNEGLETKAQRLAQHVWPRNLEVASIDKWIAGFQALAICDDDLTRRHCLYVLTHCIAFREREWKHLMGSLYRELVRRPLLYEARRAMADTLDGGLLEDAVRRALASTRFVGLGGAAKSGPHLIYWLPGATGLPGESFVASDDSLLVAGAQGGGGRMAHPGVARYIFVDDVCGSGQTAAKARGLTERLRAAADALGTKLRLDCFFVLGTTAGLQRARDEGGFDHVDALMVLDETQRAFGANSRHFQQQPVVADGHVTKAQAKALFQAAGEIVCPAAPLGYGDCQLILALHYNTPDNTLPAIWSRGPGRSWHPVFERNGA